MKPLNKLGLYLSLASIEILVNPFFPTGDLENLLLWILFVAGGGLLVI